MSIKNKYPRIVTATKMLRNELNDNLRLSFRYWIDCNFKSTKKLNHDILDSVDKSKNFSNCMFPLANLQSAESLYCVPDKLRRDLVFVVGLICQPNHFSNLIHKP